MASSEAVHPWEHQEEEEMEGLRIRRKSLIQTPLSTTINGDFKSNNGGSIGPSNGEEEEQEEKVKDFGHQNGREVDDEDEKSREKEKQQRSDYLVYYDTDKGIWKCRVCSWDYQGRTCLTDHSQEPKPHLHMLVNVKSVDQQRLCFFNETKGTVLHFESSVVEADGVDCTTHAQGPVEEYIGVTTHDPDNGNGLSSVIINQKGEHQDHNNFCTSRLQPSEISFEELDKNFVSYRNNNIENADIEVINDGNDEVTEYDVETVLKKQETHDLYCPNCNSCITKRVILRKRKRRIRTPGEDAKRNKPETLIPSEANIVSDDPYTSPVQTGIYPSLGDSQPLASNEYDQQREPDIFRCLSCFSIFMPTGNGFKLFRIFGNKNDKQNNQCSQKEARVKKGWLSSIFASDKELLTDQADSGAGQSLDGQNNVGGVSVLSSNPSEPNGLSSLTQEAHTNSEEGVFYPHHKTQEANSHTINGTTGLEDKPASDYVSSSNLNEPRGHVLEMNQGPSSNPSVDNSPSSTQGSDIIEWTADKSDNAISKSKGGTATDSLEVDADDQLLTSYHIESNGQSDYPGMLVVKPPFNNVEPAENPPSPLQHDGLKLLVPPNVGSLIIDNSQMNQNLNVTIQTNGAGSDEKEKTSLSFSASDSVLGDSNLGGPMDGQELPANPAISGQEKKMEKQIDLAPEVSQQCIVQNNIEIHLEEPLKVDKDVLIDKQIKLHEDLKNIKRPTGKDTIITIESKQLDASAFQRSPDTPGMTGTSALHHVESGSTAMEGGGTTTTPMEGRSLDIVKSIVYGGLIESIASLSVVSSAAGADAATLNVLALGLANIFGGLFVISNDLWDLKNEATRGSSNEAPEHEERYQQLLGRKSDFPLHMVVSLLSYLVFGLLPPTVYGFSFRVSNNKDLKLLTMAAASIACIMILAAGKAYVQRPHRSYFKTIAYYVVFGFMVSGVSYLFGDLIMKFLEKIDIFQSGSVVNLNIHGVNSKPAIATY